MAGADPATGAVALSAAEELALLTGAAYGGGGAAVAAPIIGSGTALQLGALGLNLLANEQASRRQKKLAGAMEKYQLDQSRKAGEVTEGFLAGETPGAREEARVAQEQDAAADLERTIGASNALESNVAGKASDRYTMGKIRSDEQRGGEQSRLIEQISRMRAPTRAGQARARQFSQAAGSTAAARQAQQAVGRGYGTDISNVQPNPWVQAAAQGMYGYGSGLAISDAMQRYRRSRSAPAFSTP